LGGKKNCQTRTDRRGERKEKREKRKRIQFPSSRKGEKTSTGINENAFQKRVSKKKKEK